MPDNVLFLANLATVNPLVKTDMPSTDLEINFQ